MTSNDSNSDQPQEVHFSGEEDIGKRTTPAKDLGAAYVIGLFALGALVLAALMPVIQMPYTAAGLLPGVTAITLFAMAIGLGRRAIRKGAKVGFKDKFFAAIRTYFTSEEDMRTVGLFVFVGVYIIFLLELNFYYTITAFGIYRPIGSFEIYTVIFLTGILKFFWGSSFKNCLLVAFGWTFLLTAIFVHGFSIPMPGML
jgi:hypothetical protein